MTSEQELEEDQELEEAAEEYALKKDFNDTKKYPYSSTKESFKAGAEYERKRASAKRDRPASRERIHRKLYGVLKMKALINAALFVCVLSFVVFMSFLGGVQYENKRMLSDGFRRVPIPNGKKYPIKCICAEKKRNFMFTTF